jgi:hypothetical protein
MLAHKRTTNFLVRKRPDQVLQNSLPFPLGVETFFKSTKGRTGPAGPSPVTQEASGIKSSLTNRADPYAKEPSAPPLDVVQNKESGTPPPEGQDTQDASPVDYSLEIEAEFPVEMVIELQKNIALRAQKP